MTPSDTEYCSCGYVIAKANDVEFLMPTYQTL